MQRSQQQCSYLQAGLPIFKSTLHLSMVDALALNSFRVETKTGHRKDQVCYCSKSLAASSYRVIVNKSATGRRLRPHPVILLS
jgi:hypothetical protein